jgi:MerR family transcriptional regulator, mercuric resistance operon regulatory protein
MRSITAARAPELTIGRLSELTGVNIETIRYYERTKVLPAPARTANGRRVYQSADIRILAFLRRARELGFSLDEIRALLRLGGPEKASCREVRRIATHHLDDIRAKISDLRKLERLLAKTVAQCTGTTAPVCRYSTFSIFRAANRDACAPPRFNQNSGREFRQIAKAHRRGR